MARKLPFVGSEKLHEIVKEYPTPFHLYDEAGIRATAKAAAARARSMPRLRGTGDLRNILPSRRRPIRLSSIFCGRKAAAWTAPPKPS